MTDQELYDFHQARLNSLDPELREKMVALLRGKLTGPECNWRPNGAITDNPLTWWIPLHFTWGMGVRSALRKAGFTEAATGLDNLDNYWVGLVELAIKEQP